VFLAALSANVAGADAHAPSLHTGALLQLAESEFRNLTPAERALLQFADVRNHARGDFAFAGANTVPDDPSNDPTNADNWEDQRSVRAELVRWMCTDPEARTLVDPRGIRLLGASRASSICPMSTCPSGSR
jgi:hypothetical protein